MKAMKALILLFVMLTGCRNMLQETAKKDTPEAVFYQAKMEMNDRDYESAINLMQTLAPSFLAQRHVALVYASAFSGRCGLDFVNFVTDLENVGSASSMFSFLMQQFPDATDAKIADCVFSESVLNNIGNQTQRNSDENILMGLSSLTKVGTVLSRYADTDGNGSVDGTFDHCDTTDFPDTAIREVGTGIAQAILSVSAVGSDITADTLTEITDLCALDPNLNVFCTTTDPNAYSNNEIAVLRAILGSTNQGVGACPGNFTACICP